MSIEIIKKLQEEVTALRGATDEAKAESKALADKLEESFQERKRVPSVESFDEKSLKAKGTLLYVKAAASGRSMDSFSEYAAYADMVSKAIKPADVTSWTQSAFSGALMEAMRTELILEPLFPKYEVPSGVQNLEIPAKASNSVAYLIAPAVDAIESAMTAAKVSLKPVKFKTLVSIADETANETIITAIADVVRADMAKTIGRASEDAIINGDTNLTVAGGSINGEITATSVLSAFAGLRKAGMSNTVDFGAGADSTLLAKFRDMRKSMGIYGMRMSDLVYVVSPALMYRIFNMPEVTTVDKYGVNATVLTGEIGKIDGVRIIVSDNIPVTLLATGKAGGALTGALLVNVRYFGVGTRGGVTLEQDRNIINGTTPLVAQRYLDFKPLMAGTKFVSYGINISL